MIKKLTIKKQENGQSFLGCFSAMASECEVLVECTDPALAEALITVVFDEAKRIENKFSRYQRDNIVAKINNSNGKTVKLDDETAHLLDFASLCYQISHGLFDITSGVLRQLWTFNGSDHLPSHKKITKLLPLIGFDKITWNTPDLTLPVGMEIDFGGIGKEYAVDCCLVKALKVNNEAPILINFGGDLNCNGPRRNGQAWKVGIESVGGGEPMLIRLKKGALATSGDANRYLFKEGIRYSHILNPLTGYSIENAHRSITVAAESCVEAGLLSTLGMLQGNQADAFLTEQNINFWIQE